MIAIRQVSKYFDEIEAVHQVSLDIHQGTVFGMLGTNGAGKSTLLRMIAGILQPDCGKIVVNGELIWDNPKAKSNIFYVSDDQYYFINSKPEELADFYQLYYPDFDRARFHDLMTRFHLDPKRKIQTFSKGMKKQLSIILGLCANTPYLLCDETFDGLDPVMRQGIKSLFAQDMEERQLTPIIASHNLRELEDICDHIGVLHEGGILLSKDLDELKCQLHKIQVVLPEEADDLLRQKLNILQMNRRGKLLTMTVRGEIDNILPFVQDWNPVYVEALPLSLEEIFISEMEVVGYDFKKLIF